MNKLKDKILQYIISGKYAEDKAIEGDILNDPAFDAEEFQLLKDIWEFSDNLKDYKTASKSDAWQNIVSQAGLEETRVVPLTRRLSIAASIVILIGVGLYFYLRDPYITLPATTAQETFLPDNSRVRLTPGSSVRYLRPRAYAKASTREVYLTGEAVFDVEYDPARPFKVITDYTSVDVTGTEFRYKEEGINSEAENMSGQVTFGVNDGSQSPVVLNPGDKASYDGDSITFIPAIPPPPPPPPPPTNNLTAFELVEILGAMYAEHLELSPGLRRNNVVIKVNLNLSLGELLQSMKDDELITIDFSDRGNGYYYLSTLIGIESGLQADYSYSHFELGVPFTQPSQ